MFYLVLGTNGLVLHADKGYAEKSKPFAVAEIAKRTLNYYPDVAAGTLTKRCYAQLKAISGSDSITINAKNESLYRTKPYVHLAFGANDIILPAKDDDAYYERLILVPALYSVPKNQRDPFLLEKLLEEKEGIVNNLLKYAVKVIQAGGVFPECPKSEAMKRQWRGSACPGIVEFVRDACVLDPDVRTASYELFDAYTIWCERYHVQAGSFLSFRQLLPVLFPEIDPDRKSVHNDQRRGLKGIALKSC